VRRAEELLNLPVYVRGIELGRPVDLIVDRDVTRTIGFDVLCGDEAHRFLPFAVARVGAKAIEIDSPFVLLDFDQVAFYREQASSLRTLNGDRETLLVDEDGSLRR
jgi:hypothetical protein